MVLPSFRGETEAQGGSLVCLSPTAHCWQDGSEIQGRVGKENQGRCLALRFGQSITTLIIITYSQQLSSTDINEPRQIKIFIGYEVCGLQTYLDPDHISVRPSLFPHTSRRMRSQGDVWPNTGTTARGPTLNDPPGALLRPTHLK